MSKVKISQNLTFKQFNEYAERSPSLEGNWIYRVDHICITNDIDYPKFEVYTSQYYFLTFEDAENSIFKEIAKNKNSISNIYCFRILQLSIGTVPGESEGAAWLYDHEGKLVDYTITTWEENPYKCAFFGRPERRLRFKKGDIVEVISNDIVNLAIIGAEGPSVKEFWKLYNRCKDQFGYFADASDDCYYVIDGPGFTFHSHVPTLSIMKPRFPIPEDIKEYFYYCLDKIEEENNTDRYIVASCNNEHMEERSTASIQIKYDSITNRHILVQEIYDNITGTIAEQSIRADDMAIMGPWFKEVLYGKSRLWYIIRQWNEQYRKSDEEPSLPLDTPLNELVK